MLIFFILFSLLAVYCPSNTHNNFSSEIRTLTEVRQTSLAGGINLKFELSENLLTKYKILNKQKGKSHNFLSCKITKENNKEIVEYVEEESWQEGRKYEDLLKVFAGLNELFECRFAIASLVYKKEHINTPIDKVVLIKYCPSDEKIEETEGKMGHKALFRMLRQRFMYTSVWNEFKKFELEEKSKFNLCIQTSELEELKQEKLISLLKTSKMKC